MYTVEKRKKRDGSGREPYEFVISADADLEGWLKERQKLLTATDIPSILGVPGARDPLETWYQKKDALVTRAENDQIREAKRAGHDFEDFNALMFSKAAGRRVERSQQLIRSRKYSWLGCTLDYLQTGETILNGAELYYGIYAKPLELKNAGSFVAGEMWPLGGEPHLTWQMQVITQMIVMDVSMGSLSAWLGTPFVHHRWVDVERLKPVEEIILEEAEQFWKSLKKNTPPSFTPNSATYEVLRRLAPSRTTGKIITLPATARALHARLLNEEERLEHEKESFDLAKAAVEKTRAEIAALIGENEGGKLPPTGISVPDIVYTFQHVHVPTHTVQAHSYRKLNRSKVKSSKKKTVWKTSKR